MTTETDTKTEQKPDENSGILVEDYLRISDPETGEELINQRGD